MLNEIKYNISRIPHYVSIAFQLHSKAPTKEIKNNWRILVIGGMPVTLLTLLCGERILWFFKMPKIDIINSYGTWIFFIFIVSYCIVFFDYKKCKEITDNQHKKYSKT
jgi:hypothetical protein